jgi:integrase
LHKALQQDVKMQIINKNVTDYVELSKKKPFDIKVYNESQVKALLEAVKDTELYLPVLIAVTLGLRRGKVLGLILADIDYEYNLINISRTQVNQNGKVIYAPTKTVKSKRSILVSDNILELLKKQKA